MVRSYACRSLHTSGRALLGPARARGAHETGVGHQLRHHLRRKGTCGSNPICSCRALIFSHYQVTEMGSLSPLCPRLMIASPAEAAIPFGCTTPMSFSKNTTGGVAYGCSCRPLRTPSICRQRGHV